MKRQLWKIIFLPCLLVLLLFVSLANAGGPVGHPETLEGDLHYKLQSYFDREGYLGRFPNGQDLQRGISAYLWDNRLWLKSVDFHRSRKVDAVVCLLHKKGYPGFESYFESRVFENWCSEIVAQP